MQGLTIKETAQELGMSTRTVVRMIEDGRLEADKQVLPDGKRFVWMIRPLGVARIQVKRELKAKLETVFKDTKVSKSVREVIVGYLRTD